MSSQNKNSSFLHIYHKYKQFIDKELKSKDNQYILPLILGICNDLEQIKQLDGKDFRLIRKACLLKLEYEEWNLILNKIPF
ncbi:hypothetical protein DB313_05775 (plasmid) [Borrelia turcica IST7]|uniref:Uncharacterized protein n=1 Tax=Borrelia turcica IST7 TaxID=1104446 RepID=A0A386PPB8_9SPIR|nr:DUF1322 family protein [Borrelia turcica]AYE37008.1 hypothetical protein DB313_05775 [Borrelia turcica IST7]